MFLNKNLHKVDLIKDKRLQVPLCILIVSVFILLTNATTGQRHWSCAFIIESGDESGLNCQQNIKVHHYMQQTSKVWVGFASGYGLAGQVRYGFNINCCMGSVRVEQLLVGSGLSSVFQPVQGSNLHTSFPGN